MIQLNLEQSLQRFFCAICLFQHVLGELADVSHDLSVDVHLQDLLMEAIQT